MPTGKQLAEAALKVLQPLLGRIADRLKALEDRKPVEPEAIRALIDEAVKRVPRLTVEQAKDMIGKAVTEAAGQIRVPKDGEPGRDALAIEILPAIDPARSYARGTYASWRGGVVRAARTTDYLDDLKDGETVENKGWQVVVNGIGDRELEQVSEREFVMRLTDTAGKKMELKFAVPMMIYRGVWREGQHKQGDCVTWGGSPFHCNKDTTEKPGTGKDWQLAVKRGADGKDKTS